MKSAFTLPPAIRKMYVFLSYLKALKTQNRSIGYSEVRDFYNKNKMLMCLLMQCIAFILFYNSLGVCGKPPRINYIYLISKDKYNLILRFVKSGGKCDTPVKEKTRQYRSACIYYWRHKDKLTLGMSFICFFEFVYSMLLRVWFAWYIYDFWCNMPNWISFGVPLIIYCPDSN